MGDVLILPERHPAHRRREAQLGSCTERENLAGDAKGKGASGDNRKAESTDAPERGGLPRSSDEGPVIGLERRGQVIAVELGPTGFAGRSPMFSGRRQPSCGGTSRMMREYHVRFCERLGVKFPGPTRQNPGGQLPVRRCTSVIAAQERVKKSESQTSVRLRSVIPAKAGIHFSH